MSASVHAGIHPPEQTDPPGADGVWKGVLCPGDPHLETPCWTETPSCTMESGRYASYWNAFLSKNEITRSAENRRKRQHKRKLMSKYPRKFSRTPLEGQGRRSLTPRNVRVLYKTPKRRRIFNPNVLFASRSKLRKDRKNATIGESAGRKGAWKITPQKDTAGTLAEQGRSVNKTGTLERPVEKKVQLKGNSAVNEERDKTRQQVQSENRENGKEATTNTRMESPISVRIVQTQVEHPVDGVLEVTAQVKQEISLDPNKEKTSTAGEFILHEVSTTQVPPELMTDVMTVAEVHREFSPYQTHTGRAGDERRSVEPDSTTNAEEHPDERRSVETMLTHSDTEEDPDGLGTLCIELDTDEQSSDERNPTGPSQDTGSTQQEPSEDTASTQQGPSQDTASTQQGPSQDTASTQQGPSQDTASTQQGPSKDTASTQQRPAQNTASTQQGPPDADSTMRSASDDEYHTGLEHCSWFSTPAIPEESGTSQHTVDQTPIGSQESGTRQNGRKKKNATRFQALDPYTLQPLSDASMLVALDMQEERRMKKKRQYQGYDEERPKTKKKRGEKTSSDVDGSEAHLSDASCSEAHASNTGGSEAHASDSGGSETNASGTGRSETHGRSEAHASDTADSESRESDAGIPKEEDAKIGELTKSN